MSCVHVWHGRNLARLLATVYQAERIAVCYDPASWTVVFIGTDKTVRRLSETALGGLTVCFTDLRLSRAYAA